MKLDKLIELSLQEDLHTGDVTTQALHLETQKAVAYFIAKQKGVVAGLDVVMRVFKHLDPTIGFVTYKKDGDSLQIGDDILKVTGNPNTILTGERVALNFLQRLSGVASATRKMVEIISPYGVKLLDTRKTTPLLRELEKYAVRVGGGYNHRFGLYDMIMIKDNHIYATGSIKEAINRVKKNNLNYRIEVEVKDLKEFRTALACSVDRILLDNMTISHIKKAVAIAEKACSANSGTRVELEVSGGITLENIEDYADTGIDFISTGAVTHSVKALDITLLFREK